VAEEPAAPGARAAPAVQLTVRRELSDRPAAGATNAPGRELGDDAGSRAAARDGAHAELLLWSPNSCSVQSAPDSVIRQEEVMSAYPSDSRSIRLDRRTFLKRTGVAGAAALVASRLPAPVPASAQDMTVRPEAGAKRGGTLRYAVHNAPAHFDVHQSGTVANIGPQSPMYDTLLRRSPKDGQTIIPDLAWKWDISPDNRKYTFHLRKGVKFHDGADFTAEDVKATYERIARPPKGVVIPRTPLFATVGDIVVVDPHTIEFRMTEPRPKAYMLGAFASGWNIIVRKKTLEENQGNLRQVMNYPGTGPFKHVSRKDKEVWIMERNPGYWNKGLPLIDRLEVYHFLPFTPELGASLLSGRVDYARLLDPVTWRKAREMKGVTAAAFNQSVIQAFWTNMQKNKALADRRVRRAIHLAMDRHTLVEVVKDTAPMQVGGFVYPFHEMSTPRAELEKKLGYQRDVTPAVQEARRLMKEAGYGGGIKNLDFVVRDIPTFKLWAVAIQAMLKEHLNIECNLRVVQTSVWFDEAQAGNFDLAISAIVSTLMDPSDIFSAWYGKDGPQNYSRWTNPAFHDVASQVEREIDDNKRKQLVRKAEDMLEQDPPLIPVAYEQIYDAWYNKVRGQNPSTYFGIYDVVRWDQVWLA
jgi:ABC-type transport system substrate-binding protein